MDRSERPRAVDFDGLMRANLTRVFGERDARRRAEAIRELYAEDAVLYEPGAAARGHAPIAEAVTTLLAALPPGVGFSASGPAVGHHDVGCLKWRSGAAGAPAVVTGMDVAHVENGRIRSLHVFLDPTGV